MMSIRTTGCAMICLLSLALAGVAHGVPAGFTYGFAIEWMPVPQRTGGLALADFNGDGQMDAAVPGIYMASVAILLNNGDGTALNTWVTTGAWPMALAAGDLDGDSDVDLAVIERDTGGVAILTNNGTGQFTRTAFYPTGTTISGLCPTAVAIADIDKDNRPDLVVANRTAETVVVLHNTGGGFVLAQTVPVAWEPNAMAAADFDRDTWLDVAVACASDDTVKILKNTSGTLALAGEFDAGAYPVALSAGDLNGDSYPDLAVGNREQSQPTVLINDTIGGFGMLPPVPPALSYDVLLGDINFDNMIDVVASNAILLHTGTGFAGQATSVTSSALGKAALAGDAGWFLGMLGTSTGSSMIKAVLTYYAPPSQPAGSPAGDITRDSHVDVADLLVLADSWGKRLGQDGYDPACDLNGDNSVDVGDLLILSRTWGK